MPEPVELTTQHRLVARTTVLTMPQMMQRDNAIHVEVLEIMDRVRYVVRPVHDFGLEGGSLRTRQERLDASPVDLGLRAVVSPFFRHIRRDFGPRPGILYASGDDRPGQIHTRLEGTGLTIVIALVRGQTENDAKSLGVALVSVSKMVFLRELVELLLRDMTERRVADVMQQPSRGYHILVHATDGVETGMVPLVVLQVLHEPSTHLGDLERVDHSIVPKNLVIPRRDLRDLRQPTKVVIVCDPIHIALELAADLTIYIVFTAPRQPVV